MHNVQTPRSDIVHLSAEFLNANPHIEDYIWPEATDHCYLRTDDVLNLLALPTNTCLGSPFDKFVVPCSFTKPLGRSISYSHKKLASTSRNLNVQLLQQLKLLVSLHAGVTMLVTNEFISFFLEGTHPSVLHFLEEYNKFHKPC